MVVLLSVLVATWAERVHFAVVLCMVCRLKFRVVLQSVPCSWLLLKVSILSWVCLRNSLLLLVLVAVLCSMDKVWLGLTR